MNLADGTIAGKLDGIAAAAELFTRGGRSFPLDRGNGAVRALDPASPWTVAWTIDDSDGGPTNAAARLSWQVATLSSCGPGRTGSMLSVQSMARRSARST